MKIPVNIIRKSLNQWQPETGASLLTQKEPATITESEDPLRRSYLLSERSRRWN